ncbi:MAG: flagellar basal body rod protein FlgC [Ignavibacteria bacterium]|nr:flagellar basal body rod protein FlgC [Ignavibacteria bacterium]
MFLGLNISSSGLSAQRRKMNVIANNIANAETTRTAEGGTYRRKQVVMREAAQQQFAIGLQAAQISLARTSEEHMPDGLYPFGGDRAAGSSVDAQQKDDPTPMKTIYDPAHPDADQDGYVQMPNVNVVTEMVDMIAASRAFEANVTAINATKAMAKDSLEI